MEIEYSDGHRIEKHILSLLKNASSKAASDSPGLREYENWPVRYHLSPERANLVRHLDFGGLKVLELGAGMGAVSRFLAENAASLTVIEGTQDRYEALSKRLEGLSNWNGIVSNIQDTQLKEKFDVVCVIGVLEYSELYIKSKGEKSPFFSFLELAKSWLKPEGALILAIENQFGLKYWSGAAEYYTGRLFDGICGYPMSNSPKTFSRKELKGILSEVGFSLVQEYFPFPDYKVPSCVLTEDLIRIKPSLSAELANVREFENYGEKRVHYFSDLLACHSIARAGLLPEFANSFLWVASSGGSPIFSKLNRKTKEGELAWHYTKARKRPVTTVFKNVSGTNELKVGKFSDPTLCPSVWQDVFDESSVRYLLESKAYFEGEGKATEQLKRFLKFSLEKWVHPEFKDKLRGEALDAIYTNAIFDKEGTYRLFDLEWTYEAPVPKSFYVFRNCLALLGERAFVSSLSVRNMKELYEKLCFHFQITPDFYVDCDREARVQISVTCFDDLDKHCRAIRGAMTKRLRKSPFPRGLARENKVEKIKMGMGMAKQAWKNLWKRGHDTLGH